MIKNLQTIFMVLFAMVAFTSCKDDKKDEPKPEPTKAELIVGKWQMESIAFTLANGASQRVTLPANRPWFWTFSTNGTVIQDGWDAGSLDPEEWTKELENGTYTLSSNGEYLTLRDNDGESGTAIIKELSATRLVLELETDGVKNEMNFKKV